MFTVPVILAAASLAASRAIPSLMRRETVTDFSKGSGDGTFYGTGLGACGITNTDTDMIAAIGHDFFDQYATHMGDTSGNPNKNPICNKKVKATYEGKSVVVAITDRCGGCDIPYSLDFSPAAFSKLADQSIGRIHNVTWTFVDGDGSGDSSGNSTGASSSSSSSVWTPSTSAVEGTSTTSAGWSTASPSTTDLSSTDPTLTDSSATPSTTDSSDPSEDLGDDSGDDGDDSDDSDDSDSGPTSSGSTTVQVSESSESSTVETTETQVSASASSSASGSPAHAMGSLSNGKQHNRAVRSVRIGWW